MACHFPSAYSKFYASVQQGHAEDGLMGFTHWADHSSKAFSLLPHKAKNYTFFP